MGQLTVQRREVFDARSIDSTSIHRPVGVARSPRHHCDEPRRRGGRSPEGGESLASVLERGSVRRISRAARSRDVRRASRRARAPDAEPIEIRPDKGPVAQDQGYSGDGALQGAASRLAAPATGETIQAPLANFEGISNEDNFNIFGFRVNPPDPVGDVGPNHYVEMVNLAFAIYDKQGNLLLGPVDTGTLWSGFPVEDCTDPSGDPVVLYDQFADRWLLSQFTTRGAPFYYDCVAISQTPDPTGAYYRYAFPTQEDGTSGLYNFPDYPKYSVWKDSYILTTRDFGDAGSYGISAYALEKNKMINGRPRLAPCSSTSTRTPSPGAPGRRPAPGRRGREDQAEERCSRADRRHAG